MKKTYKSWLILIFVIYFCFNTKLINENFKNSRNKANNFNFDKRNKESKHISDENCYLSPKEPNLRIIHFIITRFIVEYNPIKKFIYSNEYIKNGIRVMKKYLLPSLENQLCKNFIFILMIGNKANISYIKSLIRFNNSFPSYILFQNDLKKDLKTLAKGFDVLITTRIDYDDLIYYDAINDVRKAINIDKPVILHGYNSGVYYFESNRKFYDYYRLNNDGALGIFLSLILIINKVNDTYSIYDLGAHTHVRKNILKRYKSFGINQLNYEPSIFDTGDSKFIYVRQKFSNNFNGTFKIPFIKKSRKFNLTKFFGKIKAFNF